MRKLSDLIGLVISVSGLALCPAYLFGVGGPEMVCLGAGLMGALSLIRADSHRVRPPRLDRHPTRQPLRFYRGIDGRIHFYRKVDPVRLARLEHDLGIGIVEPEPTVAAAPAPAKVLTSSGYRSVDQMMKAIASVYRVPPPMMARRQARRLTRNCNCAEYNDYVVLPRGWKLNHYSAMEHYIDSNHPPLPGLTEPRDTL